MTGKQTQLLQDRRLWMVFAVAAMIRVAFLAWLFFYPSGMFADGDSHGYHKLALSIIHYGTFSTEPPIPHALPDYVKPVESVIYAAPLAPDEFRTPGYPGFLALIYAVGGTPFTAVAIQSLILSLLLIWLTVVLAFRLFGMRAAIAAGVLAALEPLSLIYSNEIMADTPFVLMVLAATMAFMFIVLENESNSSVKRPLFGGLFLGTAILIRPVATYLPVLFAGFAALYLYLGDRVLLGTESYGCGNAPPPAWKSLAKRLGIFLVAGMLTTSAWMARNYFVFGHAFISTASDHVLLITAGSQILSEMKDTKGALTTQQFRDVLERDLTKQMELEGLNAASPPERAAYFRDWSINVFKAHPGRFALYMLKSTATLFVSDITGMYQLLGFTSEARGGYGVLFRSGPRAALARYFGPRWPMWVAGLAPIILYDMAVYILAFLGAVKLLRGRSYFLFCFFILMIAYWIVTSSIASMPRYRFPAMPFMIVLAAAAVFGSGKTGTCRSSA